MSNSTKIWLDGELLPASDARTATDSHALHYGTGVFEGIKSYATARGAAVFRLPEHMQRMAAGAALIGLEFDPEKTAAAIIQTLQGNQHRDAYIRPLVWAGSGSFALDTAGHPSHLMVATTAAPVHLGGSEIQCAVVKRRRNSSRALPNLKLSGGYVNSVLAKREAQARGFMEAIFADDDGFIVECSGANLFMVNGGKLTAAQHDDALPGITRDTLLQLTGAEVRKVSLEEFLAADEVFACGTAAEVTAIGQVEDHQYGDNPVTRELAAQYAAIVRGQSPAHAHWLTEYEV